MSECKTGRVFLKVNGEDIPLNGFVKEVVANVVNGLVDSLDKIPVDKTRIELIIEMEGNK
jgi:hypothetical protein